MNRHSLATAARLFVLLAAAGSLPGCADDSAPDAELERLVDEVLAPADLDPDSVAVYRWPHALAQGDIITAAADDPEDGQTTSIEVDGPGTLYFVDTQPSALFGHAAKYVVIGADGELQAYDEIMWPQVNDQAFAPFGREPVLGHARALPPVAASAPSIEFRHEEGLPCPRRNYAITVDGAGHDVGTDAAEAAMRRVLDERGFTVLSVPYKGTGANTMAAMVAAIEELAALEPDTIGELVFYYTGHGFPLSFVFGDSQTVKMPWSTLGKSLQKIDADDRTIIVEACYSGGLGVLAELFQKPQVEEERITVITATKLDEVAAVGDGPAGGMFTERFVARVRETPADQPLAFDEPVQFLVPQFEFAFGDKHYLQTPTVTRVVPKLPRLSRYEHDGRCDVVGHIDAQAYSRQITVHGKWMGSGAGHLELQREDGTWMPIETTGWTDTSAVASLPMRKDGFPYNGHSFDSPIDAAPGHYRVRAVKADGKASPQREIYVAKLELQVYEQSWKPDYSMYTHPDWIELWLPLTKGSFSKGPTIQESYLYAAFETRPSLSMVDSDTDVAHSESQFIRFETFGTWSYELAPGERNLDTSYDDSYPQFNYYGMRVGFSDDYFDTATWNYLLAYD